MKYMEHIELAEHDDTGGQPFCSLLLLPISMDQPKLSYELDAL